MPLIGRRSLSPRVEPSIRFQSPPSLPPDFGPIIESADMYKTAELKPDFMFDSVEIISLNSLNFERFTKSKQKALVMFYNGGTCQNASLEREFARVANRISNEKHGFGAVDCFFDNDVCISEHACQTPMLKLYSNGFQLSSISKAESFDADQMTMLIKMTPVLTSPRITISSKLTESTLCTPRKKKINMFPWRK